MVLSENSQMAKFIESIDQRCKHSRYLKDWLYCQPYSMTSSYHYHHYNDMFYLYINAAYLIHTSTILVQTTTDGDAASFLVHGEEVGRGIVPDDEIVDTVIWSLANN